ncbi:hypothetical protein OV203_20465 [Nannocystis sp. ILAH1]|uniref:hypothetical protein n=1 Tax=unclassified Nannocystis TaxID=2627009 RepID=UPI00226FABE5|nr:MULTISPECIES: hypothetical protein [unclassified Nannocystis]MCY0989526.1 hypothetical protein [Nannocystis sp. ILAH1]MCY1064854.1 hypothetical protein [Nannocystis sp. RBIL2]
MRDLLVHALALTPLAAAPQLLDVLEPLLTSLGARLKPGVATAALAVEPEPRGGILVAEPRAHAIDRPRQQAARLAQISPSLVPVAAPAVVKIVVLHGSFLRGRQIGARNDVSHDLSPVAPRRRSSLRLRFLAHGEVRSDRSEPRREGLLERMRMRTCRTGHVVKGMSFEACDQRIADRRVCGR